MNEILAVSDANQAAAIESGNAAIEALRGELKAARDSGADDAVIADIRDQLRAARDAQRDIVREVVEANRDTLGDILKPRRHGPKARRPFNG